MPDSEPQATPTAVPQQNRRAQPGQAGFAVRCEWGPVGARTIGTTADIAVVVDVLSFTTAVSVAVDRDIAVLPFPSNDDTAIEHAHAMQAELAVSRSKAQPGQISLSPPTIRAARAVNRLVLPSPNGSNICQQLSAGQGASHTVVAACLRNAQAVGAWVAATLRPGAVVAVIPAGERWPDGSLRPAVEDLWGAGAVIDSLLTALASTALASPEALVARASWLAVATNWEDQLRTCSSGQELIDLGFPGDVEVAAELNSSPRVPVLGDDGFRAL